MEWLYQISFNISDNSLFYPTENYYSMPTRLLLVAKGTIFEAYPFIVNTMSYVGMVFMLLLLVAVVALPLSALISLNRHIKERSTRLLWVLIIFFMPIVGSLLFFAIERRRSSERLT